MFSPMRMGFPGGMAGGGIAQFLQPLQQYLSEKIASEKVQPFIDEISQLAQDRFDVDFGGGILNVAGGGDLFGGNMSSPVTPPLPAIQQPLANTGSSAPVTDLTNFGPDVGNGIPTAKPYNHVNDSITGFPSVNEPMPGIAPVGKLPLPRPLVANDFSPPPFMPAVPDIDQGFFDSDEYLNFMSKPQIGTQDMYMSRYFGQMGSGSLGGMQEKAYEDYLRRTGQTDKIMDTNPFAPTVGILPSPGGLADGFGNIFELPSTNPVYDPGSKELADYAANFNNNVQPGSLTYMDPKTGMIAY